MGRTVAELEHSLSASEWLDWLRFFALEPYGAPAMDVIQAQLRALLANIHRNEKARSEPFEPREFLIFSNAQVNEAADQSESSPALINGLSPKDWQLALYLRAWQERQDEKHSTAQRHQTLQQQAQ
jgi:hypothetical protein